MTEIVQPEVLELACALSAAARQLDRLAVFSPYAPHVEGSAIVSFVVYAAGERFLVTVEASGGAGG